MTFSIRSPFARQRAASDPTATADGTTPTDTTAPLAAVPATKGRTGRSRILPIVAATTVLVLAGGSVAFAKAQKTVSLDVDGDIQRVQTFAGSVDALLQDKGVKVGARDVVTPAGGLAEGAEIVVRHAHQVTVSLDGTETNIWTTALSADEALDALAQRGGDVRLVASRSAAGGRAELALDLVVHGAAEVLVDGQTLPVPDGDARVSQVLGELGVTLGPLDRVSVKHSDTGRVQVVVSRVVVQDVSTTQEVPFASTTQQDPAKYTDQRSTVTAGVTGVRTIVERVTTVDGVETAREPVSDQVTQAPVDEVLSVGTKKRPVVTPKATTPKAATSTGTAGPIAAGGSADSLNWAALARCESGGNPTIVSSNGLYYGLYQFSLSTWRAVGGAGTPAQASPDEQTARAKMLYNRSGAGQWPVCGKNLFS